MWVILVIYYDGSIKATVWDELADARDHADIAASNDEVEAVRLLCSVPLH